MSLDNAEIAELMALRAEELSGDRQRAYRRASRAAYKWPEEVSVLVAEGRPLTELTGIGVKLSGLIKSWLERTTGGARATGRAGRIHELRPGGRDHRGGERSSQSARGSPDAYDGK